MPMIRKPNFTDVTTDLSIDEVAVTVGNEKPGVSALSRMSFKKYIQDTLGLGHLLKPRDEMLLASAQACILPLESTGIVEFCPELYSYQSSSDSPAVLVIVATSQGTSAHAITQNTQTLTFNRGGKSVMYTAKRLSQDRMERNVSLEGEMTQEEQDRNILMVFQIPLQTKKKTFGGWPWSFSSLDDDDKFYLCGQGYSYSNGATPRGMSIVTNAIDSAFNSRKTKLKDTKGMENAMLSVSDKSLGTFDDISKYDLKRDDRFPIRVTFQFYKATDDPKVSDVDMKYIADKIQKVYSAGSVTGSLVHNTTSRITEPTGMKDIPPVVTGLRPMASFLTTVHTG